MTLFITNASAQAACNAVVDLVDVGSTNASGHILIYAGSVPADADAALGGATLLAELIMSNPAFGAAADISPGARATASSITADSSANATGTASFFRMTNRDATAIVQGAVSTSGAELNLNSVSIVSGAQVSITSMTVTMPES